MRRRGNLILTMLKKFLILLTLTFGIRMGVQGQALEPAYDKKLKSLYRFSVPVVEAKELKEAMDKGQKIQILDTRQPSEYEVSHLPNARFVNYDKFTDADVEGLDKDAPVVVYCTVGYRSERIGEKLQKLGFTNVLNLYGGIFEWVNQGNGVINQSGQNTKDVHTYNKNWAKWLSKGNKVN